MVFLSYSNRYCTLYYIVVLYLFDKSQIDCMVLRDIVGFHIEFHPRMSVADKDNSRSNTSNIDVAHTGNKVDYRLQTTVEKIEQRQHKRLKPNE